MFLFEYNYNKFYTTKISYKIINLNKLRLEDVVGVFSRVTTVAKPEYRSRGWVRDIFFGNTHMMKVPYRIIMRKDSS